MASAVISVPNTASRFALLQVDSDSECESDAGKPKAGCGAAGKPISGKSSSGKNNQNSDKKKDKRRRKKEQQQSEVNEVVNV